MAEVNQVFTDTLNEERAQTIMRDRAQAEVRSARNPGIDGLGYEAAEIPEAAYWDWAYRHPGVWQDKAEREKLMKKNPQWRRKYQPKAQVGWRQRQSRHAIA